MSLTFIQLEETDSTSSEAHRLLGRGECAPFAVQAQSQTAGRGRRGHAWQSPVGNLYATLVLPPPREGLKLGGCLPLKSGILIARFIERELGVRITLKWPNDLYFAGRKLGGLLCESSIKGEHCGELIIGIGLNLQEAPPLAGLYEAISLKEVTGRSLDPRSFGEGLLDYMAKAWDSLRLDQVPEAYQDFATGRGQIWLGLDAASNVCSEGGIGEDGSLALSALTGDSTLTLSSVEHQFVWMYQGEGRKTYPLIIADVGNSRVKIAHFERAADRACKRVENFSLEHGENDARVLFRDLATQVPFAGFPFFYLSVDRERELVLIKLAQEVGLTPVAIAKRAIRRHGRGYLMSDLGIDRLAAIEGHLDGLAASSSRRRPALVVSFGTATTIDVISVTGEHLGGYILPGLSLMLKSLYQATNLLPQVDLDEMDEPGRPMGLGRGTRTAMQGGVLVATHGAIELTRADVARTLGVRVDEMDLVLTGGASHFLAPYYEGQDEVRQAPTLILAGGRAMVLGGYEPLATEPI